MPGGAAFMDKLIYGGSDTTAMVEMGVEPAQVVPRFHEDPRVITAYQGVATGSSMWGDTAGVKFRLEPYGHAIKRVTLQMTVEAATPNADPAWATNKYIGYVEDPVHALREVAWSYNGTPLWTYDGHRIAVQSILEDERKTRRLYKERHGFLGPRSRQYRSIEYKRDFLFDLRCPLLEQGKRIWPAGLHQPIEVNISLHAFETILFQDNSAGGAAPTYAATPSISAFRLLVEYENFECAIPQDIHLRMASADGFRWLTRDYQSHDAVQIANGATSHTVRLTHANAFCTAIIFTLRAASNSSYRPTSGLVATRDYLNFLPIDSFKIVADGQNITGTGENILGQFNRLVQIPSKYIAYDPTDDPVDGSASVKYSIYAYIPSQQPWNVNNPRGGQAMDQATYQTVELTIDCTSTAGSGDRVLDVYIQNAAVIEYKKQHLHVRFNNNSK